MFRTQQPQQCGTDTVSDKSRHSAEHQVFNSELSGVDSFLLCSARKQTTAMGLYLFKKIVLSAPVLAPPFYHGQTKYVVLAALDCDQPTGGNALAAVTSPSISCVWPQCARVQPQVLFGAQLYRCALCTPCLKTLSCPFLTNYAKNKWGDLRLMLDALARLKLKRNQQTLFSTLMIEVQMYYYTLLFTAEIYNCSR